MIFSVNTGTVHFFKTPSRFLISVWEKEPGVFEPVDGSDLTKYLRDNLEAYDAYAASRKEAFKKMKVMRGLLDLVDGNEDSVVFVTQSELENGESLTNEQRIARIDKYMKEIEQDYNELPALRVEFIEFMLLCGVSPTEGDTSEAEATSFLNKLTGGNKPEEGTSE